MSTCEQHDWDTDGISVFCLQCGELWFYEDGAWIQKFWTQEEIDEMNAESAELVKRLGWSDEEE